MKELIRLTENLAKIISSTENKRRRVGELLRNLKLDGKIVLDVKPELPTDFVLAGVDGGLVKKSFYAADLMLLRAISVIFFYKDGKLSSTEYYPSAIPTPEPKVIVDPFSELEFEINANIERQVKEVSIAKETIKKYEPDVLLMHGSIIPHYTFLPDKSSLLFTNYNRMIQEYRQLFELVKRKKTILAGIIEDSRGSRFCEILCEKILPQFDSSLTAEMKPVLLKTKDSDLLNYALEKGERTFVFPYSSNIKKHPILREFNDVNVLVFYFRPSEFDKPVRMEFLGDKGMDAVADKLCSFILALTTHSSYAMPAILVEADQRAKLSEKDIEMFYHELMNRVGFVLFPMRRERRPFK